MEKCVVRVKGQGKTKEQAIAICFNSVVKESAMATKKSGGAAEKKGNRSLGGIQG
jgi:hypothetical protein